LSPIVLLLFATTLAAGTLVVRRTIRAQGPVVDLRTLTDCRFALGCTLSFLLGIGLFGSVYLMPVFLAFVRGHGSLRIGGTMLVTGIAQLITAPVAVFFLERRLDERFLIALGFAAFGAGCAMSAFDTCDTDFASMFWPQVIAARPSCSASCRRLVSRSVTSRQSVFPDASGLFNLMRNLGGAIGLALIDTVLYGRAPMHAEALLMRLQAGDAGAAIAVGLPELVDLAGPRRSELVQRLSNVRTSLLGWRWRQP
jgi:DHA2 family multidrug resistance protein